MMIALIAGGVFCLLGIFVLVWCAKRRRLASHALDWPRTTGKIEESSVEYARGGADEYDFLKFRYRYEVDGKHYSSSALDFFEIEKCLSAVEMKEVVYRYPRGLAVTVHHSELDPSIAVLEPENLLGYGRSRNLGCLLLLVGIVIFSFAKT